MKNNIKRGVNLVEGKDRICGHFCELKITLQFAEHLGCLLLLFLQQREPSSVDQLVHLLVLSIEIFLIFANVLWQHMLSHEVV